MHSSPGRSFPEPPAGRRLFVKDTRVERYITRTNGRERWKLWRGAAQKQGFCLFKGPLNARPENSPDFTVHTQAPWRSRRPRLSAPDPRPASSLLSSPPLCPSNPRAGMHRADLFLPSRPPPSAPANDKRRGALWSRARERGRGQEKESKRLGRAGREAPAHAHGRRRG